MLSNSAAPHAGCSGAQQCIAPPLWLMLPACPPACLGWVQEAVYGHIERATAATLQGSSGASASALATQEGEDRLKALPGPRPGHGPGQHLCAPASSHVDWELLHMQYGLSSFAAVPLMHGKALAAVVLLAAAAPAAAAARALDQPPLLLQPHALASLGLALSMSLLGCGLAPQLAQVAGLLRMVVQAVSLPGLAADLARGMQEHVARQYLVQPEVQAALVPQGGSDGSAAELAYMLYSYKAVSRASDDEAAPWGESAGSEGCRAAPAPVVHGGGGGLAAQRTRSMITPTPGRSGRCEPACPWGGPC